MKVSSERHANKILCEETGSHLFPSTPTISTKMWKRVQRFDSQRLLLAHFEGTTEVRKQWLEKLEFFVPTELDPNATFGGLIADFDDAGRSRRRYRAAIAEVL